MRHQHICCKEFFEKYLISVIDYTSSIISINSCSPNNNYYKYKNNNNNSKAMQKKKQKKVDLQLEQ